MNRFLTLILIVAIAMSGVIGAFILGLNTGTNFAKAEKQLITFDGCDITDKQIEDGEMSWSTGGYRYWGYDDCGGNQWQMVKWQQVQNATHLVVYVKYVWPLDPYDPVGMYYTEKSTDVANVFFGAGYGYEGSFDGEPKTMTPPDYVKYVVSDAKMKEHYEVRTQVLVRELLK